jgi:nucleoid-associated protein YgaU
VVMPPNPPTPPVVAQTHPPTPPAVPTPAQSARLALDQLNAGNAEAASSTLDGLLAQDAKALTNERLGALHDPLTESLTASAEKAFAAGNSELGRRLLGILSAMAPLDPAVRARVSQLYGQYLPAATASTEERMLYTVRRGDTLWRVDPNLIYPGQRIAVPLSPTTGADALAYHVSRGESLSSIARRIYGDPEMWRHIYRENASRITDPNRIYPGLVLILTPPPPVK